MNLSPRSSPSCLLMVDRVTQRFGGVTALEAVSLSVESRRIVGLIGPNGAGKTTLFNCITGLHVPDEGAIFFGDSDSRRVLNRRYPYEIASFGIARTFQTIRLFRHMSALENVMVGAHLGARAGLWSALLQPRWVQSEERKLRSHALEWLEFFGLASKAQLLARHLPYGYQRKLEIARAMASDPHLLLLDEPAAGMNPKEKEELLRLIRSIRERGVTLLLIEHDMKVVMPISEHVIVLDYGKKIAEGTPKEIQNNPRVIEAYLGSRKDA